MNNRSHRTFQPEKTCYTAQRAEIVQLIPQEAKRILDIGCGRGYLGRTLKAVRSLEIVGVELNPAMAEEASTYLDQVFTADVETFALPYPPEAFDCIIMADILEHLVDPWQTLARYVPFLSPDGVLVLSLPNVQHYRVIGHLILGEWEYQESGILDSGHLRFFTLKSLRTLLKSANLEPFRIERIYRARPIARLINRLCFNRLEMFLAQQYVALARKVHELK